MRKMLGEKWLPDPVDDGEVSYLASVWLPGTTHEWHSTNDPDFEPTSLLELGRGWLADPVRVTRGLPQSDLWPLQPNPATAAFSIVVADADDLGHAFTLGAPVGIAVVTPAVVAFGTTVEAFYGRITNVVVQPHQLGAIFTVTCVDYLADNAEEQIRWSTGYLDLLTNTAATTFLIADAFDQMDMGDLVFEEYDGDALPDSPFVRVPDNKTDLGGLAHIENLLRQWALTGDDRGPARYVLDQNIDPVTFVPDVDQPFIMRLAFKNIDPLADDYWDIPDPDHMTVIDGAHVDLGGSYTLRKYDGIRRVYTYPAPDSGLDRGDALNGSKPRPSIKLATSISTGLSESGAVSQARIDDLAEFYLPADVPRNRWAADTFHWRLYAAPEGSRLPALGEVMTIAPIKLAWNPTGRPWFTGRLTGYTLTLTGGRPVIDLDLRDVAS